MVNPIHAALLAGLAAELCPGIFRVSPGESDGSHAGYLDYNDTSTYPPHWAMSVECRNEEVLVHRWRHETVTLPYELPDLVERVQALLDEMERRHAGL